MVECNYCEREMKKAESCTFNRIIISGKLFDRAKYEGHSDINPSDEMYDAHYDRCHDCGVTRGGFHHLGCDMEYCPSCNEQLISCGEGVEALVNDAQKLILNLTKEPDRKYIELVKQSNKRRDKK